MANSMDWFLAAENVPLVVGISVLEVKISVDKWAGWQYATRKGRNNWEGTGIKIIEIN